MNEIQENNNSDEYKDILEELKTQVKTGEDLLNILTPLTEDGELYKNIFKDIRTNINDSYKKIRTSKSINTKYSNGLDDTKKQIDSFIRDVNSKKTSLKELISNIKSLEQTAQTRVISIEKLKSEANESKKLITEEKNNTKELASSTRRIREESLKILKDLRDDKKESRRIQDFLKIKENNVQKLYDKIDEKYKTLFVVLNNDNKNKIKELEENIEKAEKFNKTLDNEIEPNLIKKQEFLTDLEEEIIQKKTEVNSLLHKAVGGALDEGFRESMHEYSTRIKTELKEGWGNTGHNIAAIINNIFLRHAKTFFNYFIFIAPLLVIIYIFINDSLSSSMLEVLTQMNATPTVLELILFRTLIALPLLWISWFGQKNISQRKRLFEEYNHKSRMVRMYIMLRQKSYELDDPTKLEKVLIDAISNNPAEHLGKGETLVDKVLEKLHIGGVCKKLKDEMKEEVLDIIKNSKK